MSLFPLTIPFIVTNRKTRHRENWIISLWRFSKVDPEPERGYPYRHACLVKLPFVLLKKKKRKKKKPSTWYPTRGLTQLKQIAACSKQSRKYDVLPLRCIEETETRRKKTIARQQTSDNRWWKYRWQRRCRLTWLLFFLQSARSVLY